MSFDFPGICGLRSPHPKKITHFIAHSQAGCLVLQLSLKVRWRAMAAPFPVTDFGGGLMQASPE
jgi:hypothetical protein